jgi:chorismate mutase/prephenate dehydratase
MISLDSVRKEIDAIDSQLAQLVKKRIEISSKVALAKKELGLPILDPAREREVLLKAVELVGDEYESEIKHLYSTLFSVSKARQRSILKGQSELVEKINSVARKDLPSRAVVACPGIEGSYAQQAVSRLFSIPTILYFNSFAKVFEAVEKGLCPYGVLPIENSAAGSVVSVYDLMVKHRFSIARAVKVKIDHVLLANPGVKIQSIQEIESHPHALLQCGNFLSKHNNVHVVPGTNTALSAKALSESKSQTKAVIASRACAELYGLDVIAEDVADAKYNHTRFICISRNLEITPDANRFSFMLSLPHRPGALNSIISKFAAIDVNLTKLESRPIPGMDFEFRFTFDFELAHSNPKALELLSELSQDGEIEHFTFLGSYAEA